MNKRMNQRGFTLMELMVVIVIVAILAAVAVPLYINYVRDAQRTEAKGAIGAIISAEQVKLQGSDHHYLTPAGTTDEVQTLLGIDLTESRVNWDFQITTADDTKGFQVIATGHAGTPADGLVVYYTHDREAQPLWEDETTHH